MQTLKMGIQKRGGGRVTLLDDELRIYPGHGDGRVEVQKLESSMQFEEALKEHFKMKRISDAQQSGNELE